MGADSKIEWTDATWNPVRGCTRVSEGCRNCYAEAMAARFSDPGMWGHGFAERTPAGPRWTGKVELQPDQLTLPLHWKKPRRIFVNSTSDIFHERLRDEDIDRIFAVMALCPQHTFQILTKRPDRMWAYATSRDGMGNADICRAINEIPAGVGNRHGALKIPLPNVWLGVSVENQEEANRRIPDLLATPAAKRFLSCEPLLWPVDLTPWLLAVDREACGLADDPLASFLLQDAMYSGRASAPTLLHWVICGGESGAKARPMERAWAESLRDQCRAAGVAFFMKQMTKKAPIPDDLMVREFPKVPA